MPVDITATRDNSTGSLPNVERPIRMGFVGTSFGTDTLTQNYTVTRASDSTSDSLSGLTIKNIRKISPNINDSITTYKSGTDFTFTAPNTITWLDTSLGVPELESEVINGAVSGSFGTTAYNYKIVAIGTDGTTGASAVSTVTGIDATSGHRLLWNKIDFATGYVIYDSTAGRKVTIIADGGITSYDRLSVGSTTAETAPSSNTAKKRPSNASSYYVDYIATSYNNNPDLYNSLNTIQNTYGTGSDLYNMGRLIMNDIGLSEMYICSTDGTSNSAFMSAVDKLARYDDCNYVSALKDSTTVQIYAVTHATNYSKDDQKKERFAPVSISNTITSVTAVQTALGTFGGEKRAIPVIANGNKVYMNTWQEADGSYTDNKLVGNHFLACAWGAVLATRQDSATSGINAVVNGFNYGTDSGNWNDALVKNQFEADGSTYIKNESGRLIAYNDNTNSQGDLEDRERCVLSGEDEMRRRLRAGLQVFLGKKITDGLKLAVTSRVKDILDKLVTDEIIDSYSGLEIIQNAIEKVVLDITFSYAPIYPLKQIKFNYSFSTIKG